MKKDLKKLLIVVSVLCIISCKRDESAATEYIKIMLSDKEAELKPEITEIIPLETSDSALVGRVERLSIKENRILILDKRNRRSLFLFDRQGNFIKKTINGKGPGECLGPTDYYIDDKNNSIQLYDVSADKFLFYDWDLDHQKSESASSDIFFRSFTKSPNGNWIVHYQNQLRDDPQSPIYSYLNYSPDFGSLEDNLLPSNNLEHRKLSMENPISREDTTPLFCRPFDQTIYKLDEAEKLRPKYYLDFGKLNITAKDFKADPGAVYELMRSGDRVTLLGDLINHPDYFGCSFVFRQQPHYLIYDKRSKKNVTSFNINQLPYGQLKGITENGKFILLANPTNFRAFAEQSNSNFKGVDDIEKGGNDLIVLFRLS